METIINHSIKQVAIQGSRGAFHEIAARKYFGENLEVIPCETFPALFQAMASGKTAYGVVAIENTLAGTILPNYALLRNGSQKIVGEIYLRISHQLLTLDGVGLENLKEVHSHPMAIEQCREFFNQYPHIRLVESDDTAASAEWVSREGNMSLGAIASMEAGRLYGLKALAENIETNPQNYTRFFVVVPAEQKQENHEVPNKASICFNLKHEVGSLAQILSVFGMYGMNLTKIQSSPIIGKVWSYFFHIDLEFVHYERFQLAISATMPLVDELKILGEYQKGEKF